MNLVLYSGGHAGQNRALDEEMLELLARRRNRVRMTFIPSSSWKLREQFAEFFDDFHRFGIRNTFCLPVDAPVAEADLKRAFASDIIYLGGGNTYYFLKCLRARHLFSRLRNYARNDGVLAGLSAGAIIMTPNIHMAGIPKRTADHNEVRLKNLRALNLAPFEFHPHYGRKRWENAELLRYSKTIDHPLYACPDGAGIIVQGKSIRFVGHAHAFVHGKYFAEIDQVLSVVKK